jgi:hypothetical protein
MCPYALFKVRRDWHIELDPVLRALAGHPELDDAAFLVTDEIFLNVYARQVVPAHGIALQQRWPALSEQRFAPDKWIPCRLLT